MAEILSDFHYSNKSFSSFIHVFAASQNVAQNAVPRLVDKSQTSLTHFETVQSTSWETLQ